MGERCVYAYRKKGDVSVHCRRMNNTMDYCGHQYMCPNTRRWEVNKAQPCALRTGKDK